MVSAMWWHRIDIFILSILQFWWVVTFIQIKQMKNRIHSMYLPSLGKVGPVGHDYSTEHDIIF